MLSVSNGGTKLVILAGVALGLAMATWWALLNWTPEIVSISNGVLEVSRGADADSFDLRDPSTPSQPACWSGE